MDQKIVGVIEAKPAGTTLSGVEWQSAMYAEGLPPDVRLKALTAGRFKCESRITTNIGHLSAARLKTIEFPIPPMVEQRDIVELADQRFADIGRLRVTLETQMRYSLTLRRGLLAAAFSGKLIGQPSDIDAIEEQTALA